MTSPVPRFRLVESRVSPDRSLGVDCVRFDSVIEETDNPRVPGGVLVQVNRDNLACRHQSAEADVILLGVSERYVKSQVPQPLAIEAFRDEWAPFRESLRFLRQP